jgi:hypothetical protein
MNVTSSGPAPGRQPARPAENREGLAVLLAPSLRDRRVLVLGDADEADWVVGVGARDVMVAAAGSATLPGADGGYDVVVALAVDEPAAGSLYDPAGGVHGATLAEVERVLAPGGFCVLRARAGRGGADARLADLAARFRSVVVVDETAFLGVCFTVEGTEDMAVAGDLARLQGGATHRVVLCTHAEVPAWELGESLLIPLGDPVGAEGARLAALIREQAARMRALTAECDNLREALMSRQDEDERRDDAVVWLRHEVDRQLGIIGADQAALEVMSLEKSAAEARAARAAEALAEAEVTLRRRTTEIASLEREIQRLRSTARAMT